MSFHALDSGADIAKDVTAGEAGSVKRTSVSLSTSVDESTGVSTSAVLAHYQLSINSALTQQYPNISSTLTHH